VCLIDEYRKPGISIRMAQWTRFRDSEIKGVTLMFDGRRLE